MPICSSSPWCSIGSLDALLVDVGAVQRTGVGDDVALVGALDLGVAPRHGDVVEDDLAVGVPAEPGDAVAELEAVAGLRRRRGRSARRRSVGSSPIGTTTSSSVPGASCSGSTAVSVTVRSSSESSAEPQLEQNALVGRVSVPALVAEDVRHGRAQPSMSAR